jgi:GTP diphosphokinase / guanosine-3',5'-bis(diphosphate) 3'-diphosphatase
VSQRGKQEKGKFTLIEEEKSKDTPLSIEPKKGGKNGLKAQLYINGEVASQYEYAMAECCNAVQGDDVFAYTSSSNIIKIHRVNCKNADNLMTFYGNRILKAEWGASSKASFVAEVLITGIDNGVGMIERLSNKISSDIGLDIRSFSIEGNQGYFEGRVKLVVTNKDQLVLAIKALKELEGVNNVVRVD